MKVSCNLPVGEYGGIGVVIGADQKNITRIISVFPGSSAEKMVYSPEILLSG